MKPMNLVIVDTTGIQPYIFGSNRLRENVGASHLVAQATGAWALEAMPKPNNVCDAAKGSLSDAVIDKNGLAAEVLYAGGGNVVALFKGACGAKQFTRELSLKALTEAPGLQLVVTQRPFDWDNGVLASAVDAGFRQLAKENRSRPLSAPLLGLGVTVMCQSTGLPATGLAPKVGDDEPYPASAEILAKLDTVVAANQRLKDATATIATHGYSFPVNLEDLGRSKGEHSYMAVIHADGNGMGDRIIKIGNECLAKEQNREYIGALRAFSQALNQAATNALNATLARLVDTVEDGKISHPAAKGLSFGLPYDKKTGERFLPFRPIVFGGDDVTFVCDGRLALSLAKEYLRQFENATTGLPGGKGSACAGIAIVKSHYPFARAYGLAEELCGSAKTYRQGDLHGAEVSVLDWHFAMSGLAGGIEEIRKREYTTSEGKLHLRPVTLRSNTVHTHRAWSVVHQATKEFQEGTRWAGRRNKVKALRDALREGSDAVKAFLLKFNEGKSLPVVCDDLTNWKDEGWQGEHCGYFDAIELCDWYIPLKGGEADEVGTIPDTEE